ncbi:Rho GTPase activation protein [Chytriomyces sp. MP71]|nr:Rho GTPase activation protein [Chytriomyces sp. MP71]
MNLSEARVAMFTSSRSIEARMSLAPAMTKTTCITHKLWRSFRICPRSTRCRRLRVSVVAWIGIYPMRLLAEQSALDRISIRRMAVTQLENILGRKLPDLEMDSGNSSDTKVTVWSRLMKGGNVGKKAAAVPVKKSGTFGVPLAILVQDYGVETQLIFDDATVRIPKFVELCIQRMRNLDMSVEGVFRKNGNIRRLKETAELFDLNPTLDRLDEESSIQVAALLKKFLRDMPDPLLTSKLHPLFIASQNFDDPNLKKRVLHLLCCLLPRQNLDLLQILLQFMRYVAQFKETNKMDIPNLATVIAPNILYSVNTKNPSVDQPYVSIKAVQMLAVYQDEFRLVPNDIRVNSEQ